MLNDSMPLNYKMQPHANETQQKAKKQMRNKRKNEYIRVNNRNEKKNHQNQLHTKTSQ